MGQRSTYLFTQYLPV